MNHAFSSRFASDLLAPLAAAFTQQGRLLSLDFADARVWSARLLAHSLTGEERLSGNYRFDLRCVSPEAGIPLKEMLGQVVRIGIHSTGGGELIRCGIVSEVRNLGADGGLAAYELVVEPPLALLRHRHGSRVFQDRSVPDIVRDVLADHERANPVFRAASVLRMELGRSYPQRSYCVQYGETDLAFIERLLAEEGIAWRFEHEGGEGGEGGEGEDAGEGEEGGMGEAPRTVFVLFDDPLGLPPVAPDLIRFHRIDVTETDDGVTVWTGGRRLGSGQTALASFDYTPARTHRGEAATSVEQGEQAATLESTLEDYSPQTLRYGADQAELAHYAALRQQTHDRARKSFFGEGNVRRLEAGRWFSLAGHPEHDAEAPENREFVVVALQLRAQNNLPAGPLTALAWPGGASGDDAPFHVRFEAVRRGIGLAPSYAHTPHTRPTARGPQTATVVGPQGEEIHTDEHGRIKIQFHWQRKADHPDHGAAFDDRSSCWLRVAGPSAGRNWGHQFIPRIGQEVLVDFLDGDIDRPLVVGVLGNGSHPPPSFSGKGSLPANKALSGIRSQELAGEGYNELLFDDTAEQLRVRLSSEHAASQLNLGYLTHPRADGRAEARGEGAELRSDAAIALRGARGMLLSAYARDKASDEQLARGELLELLDQCLQTSRALAEYAKQHQALEADAEPLAALVQAIHDWDKGSNTRRQTQGGGRPAICMTAPEGLALATPDSLLSHAGLNQDVSAGQQLQLTAGERIGANAGAGISLFTQSGDLRAIAHQGQYLMQAQHGDIVAEAERNVRVSATSGEVVISAPTIRLVAEDGSFIRIGGGITLGTEGAVQVHAARQSLAGPATESVDLPAFDRAGVDQRFVLFYPTAPGTERQVAGGRRYEITLKDGRVVTGESDSTGRTELLQSDAMQLARIRILDR